jgi:ribosomal protein L21E
MKRMIHIATTSLLLSGATALFGQATTPPADAHKTETRARTDAKKTDTDVTCGRIKEFTAGQKVVVDIDNAVDKSFDLTDKDLTVKMGKGLKVGDPVKVTEHEVMGKTKSVTIAKHSGGGVAHGDKDPAAKKP